MNSTTGPRFRGNIFCASNPAKLREALLRVLTGPESAAPSPDDIIFLPSRRAIRAVEKLVAGEDGDNAAMLPKLVALGEEPEEEYSPQPQAADPNVVSNQERMLVLAKLLSAAEGREFAAVLPVARDLVRMQDYIENERREANGGQREWTKLVDEKFAAHFQKKAEFLAIADSVLPSIFPGRITEAQKRNQDIRRWIKVLGTPRPPQTQASWRAVVCGSTASVPATADLMAYVASLPNGVIILPGKITNRKSQITNPCDPYHSESKFLERVGISPADVREIDVGDSAIEFLNKAFYNGPSRTPADAALSRNEEHAPPVRIDCSRESEEAECAAEIASRAAHEGKSVLVVTPDAAGNQRLRESFALRGLEADFSGGSSGAATFFGRAALNRLDEIARAGGREPGINLFDLVNSWELEFSESDLPVIEKIKEVSDILARHGIALDCAGMRAAVLDALSSVQIRPAMNDGAKIRVLGTMESRMQSADVTILTGLNEGMFPATGYENPWLPRRVAEQIGLPPPERKVSLMALDFINLSCGAEVYWLRSKTAGGSQTTESRFLSRIDVADPGQKHSAEHIARNVNYLDVARNRDNVPHMPLDQSPPMPPADRSPVYVTELELLIHNPYAFYARHILRLKPKDDWWTGPGAKEFGTLVHEAIERRAQGSGRNASIVDELCAKAREILPAGNVLLHFWRRRFAEMAPAIERMLAASAGGESEVPLETTVAGRKVKAIADRIWAGGHGREYVLDVKTGAAPNKSQLEQGNMPQLPLEAYMRGADIMQFLQLQSGNVKLIEYSGPQAREIIGASVQKVSELFGRYSKDGEPYEHRETGDAKYKAYDDLARAND
jgi:inactivated superfamily I helicase